MKSADRLKSLEARTYQAAMLQTAQSFGGYDTRFYASMLCALSTLKALKTGCDELRRLAAMTNEDLALAAAPRDRANEPEWSGGLNDAEIFNVIIWEVFQTAPRAWRLPGGESALIEALRPWDEKLSEMDNKAVKAFLNSEIERLARIKEDESQNPTAEA
jgi:hypothetical protein